MSPGASSSNYGTTQINETDSETTKWWKFWTKRRYLVAFMAFLGFFNVYALRVNLSVAIVAMTSYRNVTLANQTVIQERDFDWDSRAQGLLLSSFFWGYIWTQLPGGWLASRLGGNRVFGVGLAGTAVLTLFTPVAARMGFGCLFAIRFIEGLFEGVTYPCIHAVWARWAPPAERSRLATIAFSGSYAGTVVSLPLCGVLAAKVGWESLFYVFGTVGLIWYICWVYVVAESPARDSKISSDELIYIENALASVPNPKNAKMPWRMMLTSMPVWAIVCAHFCENWGFYTMLTQLPTFMRDTLNFQVEKAGFMSALPYLCLTAILQGGGYAADWLRDGRMSTTAVRKLFNCGAFLSQTVFMLTASYMHSATGVIFFITIAVGLGGFAWSAFSVNHLDIAPQYASVLMGMSNTVATLPGMISPHITGYIVQNKEPSEWQIVFFISSTVYLAGAIFYGIFASGERQSWAKEGSNETLAMHTSNEQRAYSNSTIDANNPDRI